MALGETADLAVRLTLDDKFSRQIGGATKALGKFEGSVGRVGRGAGQLSSGLARAGTLIGVGVATGLAGAAKAAIDFEDAFAGVRKTVDEADLAAAGLTFEDLEADFRNMAKTIPIAATEFARLGEIAGALGVEAASIDEFVETTALLGVTTNLSADEAADAFGRIGTILGLTGDDYEELADSIVALGNAGASTESEITEITKRFAGEAKSAGLAKEEIVGLASVTASLGFAPERGGTALARVFANMGTNIALANKKGKAFAKAVGQPIEKLQDAIDRGEGLPIFIDFLESLRGLPKTEADKLLFAAGIKNTSDRSLIRTMADNLPEVNRQLEVAATATGALGEEAQKRFDTVASKIAIFKNNLIDAAITIGEGMVPAIGRATEKLTAFLQQPGNVSDLKNLGEDIGDAIDGIDWDEVVKGGREVVDIMKSAFDWAKRLFDIFNALPTEIKGATAGLLVLNKLSGGLIAGGVGNIAGGLLAPVIRNLGANLPGVGRAFVQPVFVTNMPPGGLGGPLGGGKGGGFGKLLLGVTGVGIGAMLASEFEDEIQGVASGIGQGWRDFLRDNVNIDVPKIDPGQLEWPFGPKNTPSILPEVFGGNGLLGGTPAKPTEKWYKPPPGTGPPSVRVPPGIKPSDIQPVVTNLQRLNTKSDSQKAELGLVKNATMTLNTSITTQTAQQTAELANISSAITTLPSALQRQAAANLAANQASLAGGREASVTDKPAIDAVKTAVTTSSAAQKAELGNIKNSIATLTINASTQSAAQRAELGNIKNATVTQTAQQRAMAQAQIAVTAAQTMLQSIAASSAAMRDATTQGTIRTGAASTASASRLAGYTTANAMSVAASRIVAAVFAARPIIQPTTVIERYTTQIRGGTSSDSRTAAGTGNV